MHTNLTLEERERFAYIEGRTGEAAALALAIDGESNALDEMRHERDMAQEEVGSSQEKVRELESELTDTATKLQAAEDERDTLDSEVQDLRQKIRSAALDLL